MSLPSRQIIALLRQRQKMIDSLIKGFCPTGPGGGIDNSCGREGGGDKLPKPAFSVGQVVWHRDEGMTGKINRVDSEPKNGEQTYGITMENGRSKWAYEDQLEALS